MANVAEVQAHLTAAWSAAGALERKTPDQLRAIQGPIENALAALGFVADAPQDTPSEASEEKPAKPKRRAAAPKQ